MPDSTSKGYIKIGFYVGVGFLLLGLVLGLIRWLLARATGK
jgi:hypothetical protein